MSCMFHSCRKCRHHWENNQTGGACPECWSFEVNRACDEDNVPEEEEEEQGDFLDDFKFNGGQ